jgi:dihydroneopterin aldolase
VKGVPIAVELRDLEVFGRHGVNEDERRRGRTFLYDVHLSVAERARSDKIEDTVDYRDVARCVREVSDARSFHLLEALAVAVVEALVERFPVEGVSVTVKKPRLEVAGLAVAHAAATASWISETS